MKKENINYTYVYKDSYNGKSISVGMNNGLPTTLRITLKPQDTVNSVAYTTQVTLDDLEFLSKTFADIVNDIKQDIQSMESSTDDPCHI